MRSKMDWIFVLLSLTIFTIGCATSEEIYQNEKNETKNFDKTIDYRLPLTIFPTSYEIMLELPVIENEINFNGTMKIEAYVAKPTNEIIFHVGKMNVMSTKVVESVDKSIIIQTTKYDPITEKYTVVLDSILPAGKKITIAVRYRGTLRDDMIGFYRSSYIDENGDTRWLAATQFQATHARHAFPCFDEPIFKATFTIRILRQKTISCLSNMPLVESTATSNELVWDTFGDSIVMSTYLVAFVVSDFSHLVNSERNFTVWARPNAINQAQYALKIGPQALELLSKLFDSNYQLEKMDMVALPDFAAGAMENWGLITYRETRMLYDENDSSVSSQQDVASVIVHECVHMWFGNLVTPMWWDYLWLSEAFARYYQYMTTGKIHPDWKMEQQFVVEQLQSVFGVDALDASTPMTKNVSSQGEIGTTGDTITYAKGASVVRMMELTFGSNVFNPALQEYLMKNKYLTATPKNLWSALQNQINQKGLKLDESIETIMKTWTEQPGFPVLSVNITKGTVSLRQERFFLRKAKSSKAKIIWWIPITWTTGKNPNFHSTNPKYWFGNESAEILIREDPDQWMIFNIQESGYYRVNYDKTSWYRIIEILTTDRFHDIHEVNRAALVDDWLNLARAGLLDYDTALTGLDYIKRETNYLPFKAAFSGLEYLHKRFIGQPDYDYIKNHSLNIVKYIYDDLGYDDRENDDRFTILLRKEINNWACNLGHKGCIEKSIFYFNNWRTNLKPIPKNFRSAAYCAAVRNGNSSDWNFLWGQYLTSNSASEQLVILKSLGCSENTEILEKFLLKAVTKLDISGIRKQDSTTVFSAVYGSGIFGAEYILNFVERHHLIMAEYYGGYDTIANILSGASQRFSTEKLIKKFETFINDNSLNFTTIEKSLKDSLELANYELNWHAENEDDIITWMKKNNKDAETTTPEIPTSPETPATPEIPTTPETPTTPEIPTTPDVPSEDSNSTTAYRLPTNIVPKSYIIKVTPYIEPGNFKFDGIVQISVEVAQTTNKIVFHINEIVVHSITFAINGKHLNPTAKEMHEQYNFMAITLSETLVVGTIVLIEMTYTGKLNNEMRGFYRSSYVDDTGETRWLAATHLEPVGARRMFPCFDEPALKATFVISVSTPKGYSAISNTPVESSIDEVDGRVLLTFEKTPAMSTYLVALIVSDFKSLVDEENNCATWARPNAVRQSEYALSVMAPLVKYFETVLKHPYQLPKLDMAALPDFSSGAMENWGLLTYKESNMLYVPDYSPITSKQAIANVISHEISHQWFGNQVSPRWWKYLWLSESFARYFQYHATAKVEKEWGLESQFVVEHLHSAFSADALTSSHPMTHDVYSPEEISAIFDTISYAKGASVLRMVEKSFGSVLFYEALHDYLEARKYNDATAEHLFEAFQGQINSTGTKLETTFKTIMDTWTTQAGHPVVNVKITEGVAYLVQKRFFLSNSDDETNNNIWWIPITWASKSNPTFMTTTPQYWLSKKDGTVKLNSTDEWIIFNVQETGYYRVNYDLASWYRIIDVLKSNDFTIIHEVNRASIIDDLLILGQAGEIDYEIVLSATQYLSKETNYIPWRAAFNGLAYLNRKFDGKDIYDLYKTHILTILQPIYEKLGFEEASTESHYDKILRRYVVEWACKFEVESCISSSLKYFAEFKADTSKLVPVNLRNTVYCTAIKYGSIDDWNFLWKRYLSANVATEKVVILSALGCSNNTKILDEFLTNAITENSPIRLQDSLSAFSAVYSSSLFGAEYTLDFVERKYKDMYDYYGSNSNTASILSGVSSRFSTKELVLKFEKFVKNHKMDLESISSSLDKYLTLAHEELKWYDTKSPRIYEWLDKTYPREDYRLPTKIYPNSYDIYLTPYLEENNFTFDGEMTIDMNVYKNTSSIVLQANELIIKNIVVYIDSVNPLEVSSHTINSTTHRFTIYLKSTVPAGSKLRAYIIYSGIINDKMKGFSRSSYIDENGKTRWLASTKFEPVYARQAFPCFDEPSFKATFTIHIARPNEYRTLSNMPWSISNPIMNTNRTWDSYEKSVPMSTYLVAFVMSDFKSLTNVPGNFSVWARPKAFDYGSYALQIGQEVLKFLENFTTIDYPINKMDFVAIPDFASGAMENWGLITFREYGLLQHENVTSATYKKYLNTVVAHELVHMWFGNLVTCDWWDYIWLNEGFAQYFQWIASDHTEPEWNLLQQFVVYELQVAMEIDASPNIHPMNNKVTKPLDIANSFDKIAYGKSASVIRMIHHALGPKVFELGLRTYLEKNKYKTAKPKDLWSAIQVHEDMENSLGDLNVTIESLMDSWTNFPGYPVVNASWTSGLLTLTQERFLLTQPEVSLNHSNPNFFIPVTITTKTESNFKDTYPVFWFDTVRSNSPLLLKGDEWFVINIQETGYYRVNYDENSWIRLGNGLVAENFDGIHELNRAQIIDDVFNLARIDYVSYDIALWITKYLDKEDNHLAWKAFFNAVNFLNQRFDGHEIGQDFAQYVLGLTQNIYEKIGFVDHQDENQLQQLNRQLVLSWACKLGHSDCLVTAGQYFDEWRANEEKWISPNARPAVYCASIREGNRDHWEFLWQQYEKTEFSSEKIVILNALGCSRNKNILQDYLYRAMSSDNAIRDQDVATVFSSVYNADRFGVDFMLDFLIDNYKKVQEYYDSWSNVAGLFSNVATRISTEEQFEMLKIFVDASITELSEISSSLKSSLDTAKKNIEWFKAHESNIHTWLIKAEKASESNESTTTEANSSFPMVASFGLVFSILFLVFA